MEGVGMALPMQAASMDSLGVRLAAISLGLTRARTALELKGAMVTVNRKDFVESFEDAIKILLGECNHS